MRLDTSEVASLLGPKCNWFHDRRDLCLEIDKCGVGILVNRCSCYCLGRNAPRLAGGRTPGRQTLIKHDQSSQLGSYNTFTYSENWNRTCGNNTNQVHVSTDQITSCELINLVL